MQRFTSLPSLLFVSVLFLTACTEGSGTSGSEENPRTSKIDSIESLRYLDHGKELLERHEYLDAYAAFTTSIETFDRNAEAYRCRAWVDFHHIHPDGSVGGTLDWEKALELEPDSTPGSPLAWKP